MTGAVGGSSRKPQDPDVVEGKTDEVDSQQKKTGNAQIRLVILYQTLVFVKH